ncbi:MAG: thiamine-phosphate kinase [Candidatus Thermoplasmatota archaeon]
MRSKGEKMNKLSDIGEFGLIQKIANKFQADESVFKRIGDDCAVLENEDDYTLMTTDMLVEGDHFNLDWHTPWQIGWKSVIVNISDIAAMGGLPQWGLVSIAFPDDVEVDLAERIFDGMAEASEKHGLKMIGGDTTHGDLLTINVAVIGRVEKENLCMRGDAEIGDLICVSDDLGKSWAGLELFRAGKEGYTDYYLRPRCRLETAREISPYVNAMIDVSDGLSSEVRHICEESGTGAEIEKKKVPISEKTRKTGEKLNIDPMKWALYGGEDFELVFTIPEDRIAEIEKADPIVVGKIKEGGMYIINGEKKELGEGYDHFS